MRLVGVRLVGVRLVGVRLVAVRLVAEGANAAEALRQRRASISARFAERSLKSDHKRYHWANYDIAGADGVVTKKRLCLTVDHEQIAKIKRAKVQQDPQQSGLGFASSAVVISVAAGKFTSNLRLLVIYRPVDLVWRLRCAVYYHNACDP